MTDAGKATKEKTAPKSAARTKAAAQQRRQPARTGAAEERGMSVPVPVLTPHIKVLHLSAPGMSYVEDAGRVVAAYLPPPERLAFYGGLGVAAIAGVLDWPVATAIGLGTMIARRSGRRGSGMPSGRQQKSAQR